MKYTEINKVKQTVNALNRLLKKYTDYDDLVKDLQDCDGVINGYGVYINEFWDGDTKAIYGIEGSDGFDLDFGFMGFTIYRDEKNGIRLNKNATYYLYNEKEDFTDIIDIEL